MPYSNYKEDPFYFIKTAYGTHFDNFIPPSHEYYQQRHGPQDFYRYLREDERMFDGKEEKDEEVKKQIDFKEID